MEIFFENQSKFTSDNEIDILKKENLDETN